MRASALTALLLAFAPAAGASAQGQFDFEKATLEELLNLRTVAASRFDFPAREAPGIVTVITRDELVNSGARSLIDALRLVPGLDFGVDVESLIGPGVRGNWAHEGKMLVLLDGQQLNEPFFGTAQLERVPVELVEKVEVIRGPGSSVYGGYAGLGVIRIQTRTPASLDGGEAAASFGYMRKAYAGRAGSLAYGRDWGDSAIAAQAWYGDYNRSDRRYTDYSGGSYSMHGASKMRSRGANLFLRSPAADVRVILDLFRTTERDYYGTVFADRARARDFDSFFLEAGKDLRVSDKVSVTPSLAYAHYRPYSGYDAAVYPREKEGSLRRFSLTGTWEPSDRLKLLGGAEYSREDAALDPRAPDIPFANGARNAAYSNRAYFLEASLTGALGTLSAGGRVDKREHFAAAESPRLAWTRVFDRLHLKAIYNKAFRAPGFDNLAANPALKPERTTVTELEAGYKFSDVLFAAVNVFDMRVEDPIVYTSSITYENFGRTGTRGGELTARLKMDWGYADASWSLYTARKGGVDYFSPGRSSSALLGFARSKAALSASVKAAENFTVNPSALHYSGRRAYGASGAAHCSDLALVNLNFVLHGLAGGRAEASLGVFDIFNSGYSYAQPYNGGHADLPGPSREVRGRVAYRF